ncbi:hypothetical protein LSH36_450g02070 [Paralvinella palmiformis]|uniref:Uncharacterized protein n=1 Tax=Paralvinella palmiformis TaxID=53620 RepID=A0AAD9JBL9_9ANNE|nr:hypothetical protein LSH36_450g02070 [Paralvinella palmiformis]
MAHKAMWLVALWSLMATLAVSQDLKPGQCPPASMATNDTCQSQCTADSQCPGEKICCYNGCGVTDCMSPRDGLPSSIDSRLEILACEGSFVDFVCPLGYHVKILSAFWGRGNDYTCRQGSANTLSGVCSLWNATSVLKTVCENKPRCKIPAMASYLGEPCNQLTNKYLKAEYYCQENINNVVICENSGLKSISCSNGQVIATHSAFWGRTNSPDICPHESATGIVTCSQNNANDIFREMCDGRTRCEFDPVSSVFGEICPDVHKFLSLSYSCKDCINKYLDDNQCEVWALQGECGTNAAWMTENCRRTCERCSDWKPAIVNYHPNSTECDIWARRGDCISNAPFMLVFCHQSCVASTRPTDCSVNKHDDLINLRDCQTWANYGECTKHTHYMFYDCTKACFGCHNDNYIRCANKYQNDTACEIWAADGQCHNNSGWMIPNCFKTCMGCETDPVCQNIANDTDCVYWESIGECDKNAIWMHQNCWKTCMNCLGNETTLTDCSVNEWNEFRDSDNCQSRYLQGQCASNNTDMLMNCTKSCFECDDDNNEIRCVNKYNDGDCEDWAADGECERNPGWMIPNCLKSCLRCTEDPVCRNEQNYWDCEYWQSIGECSSNPTWMHQNCWMSCMKCEGDRLCFNKASSYDCEYWMRFGGCNDNPSFMLSDCSGACTRCDPQINGVPECRDLFPESDCSYWAKSNRCAENPVWMLHYCRKSCTHCGQVSGQPAKVGADVRQVGVWRSETNAFTKGKSFVLPQKIPISGRLTHFDARLVSNSEVYLEIWRLNETRHFTTSKNFYRVYRLKVQYAGSPDEPVIINEPLPGCFEVMEDDLLGFTAPTETAPLDFRRDSTIKERTYFRSAPNERARFLSMFYTFQFAIGVLIEEGGMC